MMENLWEKPYGMLKKVKKIGNGKRRPKGWTLKGKKNVDETKEKQSDNGKYGER